MPAMCCFSEKRPKENVFIIVVVSKPLQNGVHASVKKEKWLNNKPFY